MGSLSPVGVAMMLQRLKLLKDFLGVYLNPHHGRALLERVQASNLSAADRDHVTRILRATLRLPDNLGHEPASPDTPAPSTHTSRRL
jgi:hypothetical protein